jgi:hypothetical protein
VAGCRKLGHLKKWLLQDESKSFERRTIDPEADENSIGIGRTKSTAQCGKRKHYFGRTRTTTTKCYTLARKNDPTPMYMSIDRVDLILLDKVEYPY